MAALSWSNGGIEVGAIEFVVLKPCGIVVNNVGSALFDWRSVFD